MEPVVSGTISRILASLLVSNAQGILLLTVLAQSLQPPPLNSNQIPQFLEHSTEFG